MDEQRRAQPAQDLGRLRRALGRVGRDARVERLALAHGGVERAERLLHRRAGVAPVRVEDVDVLEAHAPQALVEAREQVLPRAEVAVGPRPHVVAGLRRDHELVAIGREILLQQAPERLLRRAVGRAVVVGEVEVRDAEVERAAHDRAARLERPIGAEVLPQAERDRRQQQPSPPAAVVAHAVVAVGGGYVRHARLPRARGQAPRRYDLAAGPVAPRGLAGSVGAASAATPPPGGARASREAQCAPPGRVSSAAAMAGGRLRAPICHGFSTPASPPFEVVSERTAPTGARRPKRPGASSTRRRRCR